MITKQSRKEIKGHRKPTARLVAGEIVLDNASGSLHEYWEKNLEHTNRQ